MNVFASIAIVLVMVACLVAIPLGLPGLWALVVVTLGLVLTGTLSWTFGLTVAGAALVAEIAELWVVRRFGLRFGGSRRAFWGAVLGGTLGLFVGIPIPVIGSVITVFLGTFLGAGVMTWVETRSLLDSARVGWGVVLARTIAVGLKVAVGLAVVASTLVVLVFR